MTHLASEEEILKILEPHIRAYCQMRWRSMEMDDRLSEARLVFIAVLRTPDIPDEFLWSVYCRTLNAHMKPINSLEARHRYCRSLNAKLRRWDGEEGSTLMDLLAAPCE